MRYRLYLNALDIMDHVDVRISVFDDGDRLDSGRRQVLELGTVVAGTGESDVREWTRDALIAMLEVL